MEQIKYLKSTIDRFEIKGKSLMKSNRKLFSVSAIHFISKRKKFRIKKTITKFNIRDNCI